MKTWFAFACALFALSWATGANPLSLLFFTGLFVVARNFFCGHKDPPEEE